ncbi:MAG: hypothetical protein J6Y64_04205 [Ruminococcus sp.]|nr:hypothetical protein [Ruminococcus sp.]
MKTIRRITSAVAVYMLSVFFCIFGAMNVRAYETVTAEIPVDCSVTSESLTQTYRIKLEPETADSPVPETDIIGVSGDGKGSFDIALTEPGTYKYRIYQLKGDNDDIKYDDDVYIVTLFVENAPDDTLAYTVVAGMNGSDTKSEKIRFENIVLGEEYHVTTTTTTITTTYTTETATTTAKTTTTSAAATSAAGNDQSKKSSGDKITEIVGAVLTGDSFPAHTVRLILIISFAAAIITFLFKRKNSEEEETNNE